MRITNINNKNKNNNNDNDNKLRNEQLHSTLLKFVFLVVRVAVTVLIF